MKIRACQHLAVQAELNLLVGVNIHCLGLTVNEVLACLGVV